MDTNEQSNHAGLVVKSNELINAMVKMSLQGQRFLAYVVSLLDRNAEWERDKPIELVVPVIDFADMFGVSRKVAYKEVRGLVRLLQRKVISLPSDATISGDEVDVSVITKGWYRPKEGRARIRIDEDLVPHLLGLREQFTIYRLKDVYQFNSSHTWRIYELLKQYKGIGRREFDIDELRNKLGLEGLYYKVNNLIQCVVKPSVEEINTTSDIMAQYSTMKTRRKVSGVLFIIRDNQQTKTPREKVRAIAEQLDTDSTPTELEHTLTNDYKVSPKQARQLAKLATGNEKKVLAKLPRIKARYEKLKEKKTSLGGYLFRALKDDLSPKQRGLPL